jgi:hypothetical protein
MGTAVQLDGEILTFFRRPLMCILAAADAAGRPSAGRGVGFDLLEDRETIDVVFSAWQWARLESDLRQTGRLAVTFVSPSDYVSFQLKGTASLREAQAHHLDHAARFMAAATDELAALGVPRHIIGSWLTARDARVARLAVREIYIQTPGPLAGMLAGARSR